MTRLNAVLMVALVLSSLYLVRVSYDSRNYFADLEAEKRTATQLAVELEQLEVERRAQATNLRVEKLAREQLHMRPATPGVTDYVVMPPAAASAGVSSATSAAQSDPDAIAPFAPVTAATAANAASSMAAAGKGAR